jgi:hypothetical protein
MGRLASLKLMEIGSDLDFSDLIVFIVHLTTVRLPSLKLMEIGFDGFVEIGGVQPSDILSTTMSLKCEDISWVEEEVSLLDNCCLGSLFTNIGLLFN